MSWGTRRRNTFIFFVILIFVIPIIVIGFLTFYNPPTCFDGKENGNETGVDCGGSCELLCTDDTLNPIVIWERYFDVTEGVYNVIAYVENQNPGAGIIRAPYKFTLYNREQVAIAEREGFARIFPKSVVPIIENNLSTGKQVPNRVEFEFTGELSFQKEDPAPPSLLIKNENYFLDNFPKVTAEVQNITFEEIRDIQIIVLLYDVFDNVIATSSTYIELLGGEMKKNITFTWPNEFDEEVSRIEIVPIYESNF
jgi:hypothetical protein